MNISQEVLLCRNELNALKGVQQTSLEKLKDKFTYSASKTFSFATGTLPQTQEKVTFPKRIKLTFTPQDNQKTIVTAWCNITSYNGDPNSRNVLSINQNIDNSKITSWDLVFFDSFQSGSSTVPATISFTVTCVALSSGSINLTEY